MKKSIIWLTLLFMTTAGAFCDIALTMAEADALDKAYKYREAKDILEAALGKGATNGEKAQIYWRLSRTTLNIGDDAEDAGLPKKELLAIFEEGEAFADKAIELDPGNHLGYFWKSANMGRWGQTKGIFAALDKAAPMRDLLAKAVSIDPDHAESYFVLGELFDEVPGPPLSFGNMSFAVSFGRKSIALHEKNLSTGKTDEKRFDFYIKLAKHLYKRNWNVKRRTNVAQKRLADYNSGPDAFGKNCHYESTVTLVEMSDRDEAVTILGKVTGELEGMAERNKSQNDHLLEAKEMLSEWQK